MIIAVPGYTSMSAGTKEGIAVNDLRLHQTSPPFPCEEPSFPSQGFENSKFNGA